MGGKVSHFLRCLSTIVQSLIKFKKTGTYESYPTHTVYEGLNSGSYTPPIGEWNLLSVCDMISQPAKCCRSR